MSGAPTLLPEPTVEHIAYLEAWLAGEGSLDLDRLARHVVRGGDENGEIEDRLTEALDQAIFSADRPAGPELSPEARALHGLPPTPPVSARFQGMSRRQLEAERDRIERAWQRALFEAEYRADKIAELEHAPDAITAGDAVSRWNLLEGSRREPKPLPSAEVSTRVDTLPTATAAELHGAVFGHVAAFFARLEHRPCVLLTAETGSRKTGITLRHLSGEIERRKAAGLPYRLALAVPAHRLGREIEERARGEGIKATVFRGRGDPNKPDQPCRNLQAITLAHQAGADPRTAVCGPAPGGARCGFRDTCDYFAGLERAKAADLMVLAHNFLFEPLPAKLKHDLAGVVVDEDFAALADRVFTLTLDTLSPEVLTRFPVLADDGTPDAGATAELQRLQDMIREAAQACVDGYLTADALRSAGFTAMSGAAEQFRALSWRRKVDVQMRPGMDIEAREAATRLAAVNGQLPGIAALAHALGAILTGGAAGAGLVSVRLDMRRSGSQTVLTVRGQRQPAKWLAELPVLMLNATGRIEDVQRVFPEAELAEAPRAAWSHVEVHQIVGGFGQSTLARHKTRLAELRDFISIATLSSVDVRQHSALVVTHKSCEDHFAGMPGIATAHHGDIAGSDQHADVGSAFIIGGAFPDPKETASIAAARGGGAVEVAKPVRVTRSALLTSGAAVAIECMAYTDPAADAVHCGIYDASAVQAIGRVRPLERTADRPAVVWAFGNVALPFPVASVSRWQDRRPDRLSRMVAHGAVWLHPNDAHEFEPEMFRSAKAAEHVRGRTPDAIEAVRAIVRHDTRPWARMLYQLRGQGMRPRLVLAPGGAEAATRAAIEEKHGELASWHVLPLTEGREVIPDPGKVYFPGFGTTSEELPRVAPVRGPEQGTWRVSRPPDG